MARDAADATSIQGVNISKIPPVHGERLAFDIAKGEYTPQPSGGGASPQVVTNKTDITTNKTDIATNTTNITSHTGNVANPHTVTKAQVGLSNVDNTSDLNKPVSTAQQAAIDAAAGGGGGGGSTLIFKSKILSTMVSGTGGSAFLSYNTTPDIDTLNGGQTTYRRPYVIQQDGWYNIEVYISSIRIAGTPNTTGNYRNLRIILYNDYLNNTYMYMIDMKAIHSSLFEQGYTFGVSCSVIQYLTAGNEPQIQVGPNIASTWTIIDPKAYNYTVNTSDSYLAIHKL